MKLSNNSSSSSLWEPPGGILVWIIVFLELVTFLAALLFFLDARHSSRTSFSLSQRLLNREIGTVNTLILLTGGYTMALSLQALQRGLKKQCIRMLFATLFLGVSFLALKVYEYSEKVSHGLTLHFDSFFTFYWLITGFHFFHVFAACFILFFLLLGVLRGRYSTDDYEDVVSGGIFWHMCDLIWILVFPVLYLLP